MLLTFCVVIAFIVFPCACYYVYHHIDCLADYMFYYSIYVICLCLLKLEYDTDYYIGYLCDLAPFVYMWIVMGLLRRKENLQKNKVTTKEKEEP